MNTTERLTVPDDIRSMDIAARRAFGDRYSRQFKEGDRVQYTNRFGGQPHRNDQFATIVKTPTDLNVWVRWDDGGEDRYLNSWNLDYVGSRTPEQDEIANALATLKKYGDVTFKKKFKPVTLKLNANHTAEIREDKHVRVGCQRFTFDKVLELAKLVEQAQKELSQ